MEVAEHEKTCSLRPVSVSVGYKLEESGWLQPTERQQALEAQAAEHEAAAAAEADRKVTLIIQVHDRRGESEKRAITVRNGDQLGASLAAALNLKQELILRACFNEVELGFG